MLAPLWEKRNKMHSRQMNTQNKFLLAPAIMGLLATSISLIILNGCAPLTQTPEGKQQATTRPTESKPSGPEQQGKPMPKAAKDEVVAALEPAAVTRPGKFKMKFGSNGLPIFEEPKEESLVRGVMDSGNEKISFYLPASGPYKLTTAEQHWTDNESTIISVDANNDGDFSDDDNWYTSLPIRMGDTMYVVKEIDPAGKWIRFLKTNAPATGMVVGKPCPDFKLTTIDKKTVTLADYKGKALLLDVWSMT
jgi:hypothetical protein